MRVGECVQCCSISVFLKCVFRVFGYIYVVNVVVCACCDVCMRWCVCDVVRMLCVCVCVACDAGIYGHPTGCV